MKSIIVAAAVLMLAVAAFLLWPRADAPGQAPDAGAGSALAQVTVPELSGKALLGQRAFEAKCAACHGENAAGRDGSGPPLVHVIYEPSHHADGAFALAVANGARAHHWSFGDMPPVDGLTGSDVANIVAYVRTLQRANGIE